MIRFDLSNLPAVNIHDIMALDGRAIIAIKPRYPKVAIGAAMIVSAAPVTGHPHCHNPAPSRLKPRPSAKHKWRSRHQSECLASSIIPDFTDVKPRHIQPSADKPRKIKKIGNVNTKAMALKLTASKNPPFARAAFSKRLESKGVSVGSSINGTPMTS